MYKPLHILILEDSETDTEIVQRMLKKDNPQYLFKLSMNKSEFLKDLDSFKPDLILADNSLHQFDAKEALSIVKEKSLDIPFIMVTGSVSEEFAANIVKQGADDYILKDRLSRLPAAITAAIKQKRIEKEKKEVLHSLVQSEENLKAIFDSATESFILTDTNGVIKDFNTRARITIFKIVEKHILKGQSIFEFIEDLRKEFFAALINKILSGETVQYDKSYYSRKGKIYWINFSFSPVKKRDTITGICITGRDITEKKMAEQQKEFDHNNLYALINNTSDLMWSVDLHYNLITSNHAFDKMVMTLSGFKPIPGTNLLKDVFNVEKVHRFKKCFERAFAGESFTEIEYTSRPLEIWSEISFHPIHEVNEVIGTACFSRDITDRKKSEEKIRLSTKRISAILNTLPANIALLDKKGVIIEVNDSWKLFADQNGYNGSNYGLNLNYLTVSNKATGLNELDGLRVSRGIQNVLDKFLEEFIFEYPCDSPDIQRWFRMVVSPLKEGEYGGAVVMHIDISEIRRLEQERLQTKIEGQKIITRTILKAEEKERTRLGQELHDNISQLLAAIKMKLGFCLANHEKCIPVIEECVEYVQEAMTEARNLSHKMVIPRIDENGFGQSLESLVQKYRRENRNIKVETSRLQEDLISSEIKETLYRITQEQLNNIEKYALATDIFIQILSYPAHVDFVIRDNGIGFDPTKKSSGIGLNNIFNRAESFNGHARIISEPGKGCTLLIEIPLG